MSWRRRYRGTVNALSIDPRHPKTVYLGGAGALRSRDGGRSWVEVLAARVNKRSRNVQQVLVDPTYPGVVYASGLDVIPGSADPFALRSTDGGASWQPLDLPYPTSSFQAAPGSPGIVVTGDPGYEASTPTTWYRTEDGGASWREFSVPGPRLLVVPSQPYRLLSSDAESILRSDDGGESWQAVGSWAGCNLGPGELTTASGLAPDVLFAHGCAGTLAMAELVGADEVDLLGGRFGARAAWRDERGGSHPAATTSLSDQVGSFSRTDGDPPELLIKALDARTLDGRFWIFGAGLTRAATSLTLIDRESGLASDFVHPAGPPASFGDFTALPPLAITESMASAELRRPPSFDGALLGKLQAPDACGSDTSVLCLVDGRFRAVVTWLVPTIGGGLAAAIPLGDDAGAFWFFAESNLEVALRITAEDADPARLRVVWGSLTTLAYSLAVLDTATGELRTFAHSPGAPTSGEDPGAFSR
jgi:hypothetical protein